MNPTTDVKPQPGTPADEASAMDKLGPAKRTSAAAKQNTLYPIVWRWHFYAGLFVAPIFLVITVSGALYVFRTELTAIRDHALQVVTPQAERLSYDALFQKANDAVSPAEIETVVVYPEADRSIHFVAHDESEGAQVAHVHQLLYMDPYTGEILGEQIAEHDFFAIVLDIHRSLMLGTTGRVLGELATSWGLILLGTGVFLWWPRGKKNVGVWLPKVRGKLYSVLRDWHAVGGVYLLPLAFLVILTGMFFTVVWGTGFNKSVQQAGHWPPEWFAPTMSPAASADAEPAALDKVVGTALAESRPRDKVSIFLADKPEIAHKAWLLQDEDKNSYKMVAIDQYSGEMIESMDSTEVPPLYKVRLLAVSIHMGQIYGLPTKILALLTSFGLMALVVSGIWMWWHRRPAGRSGFPRRPGQSIPRWGWAIIVLCGLMFPVAGVSMLLIGLSDFGLQKFRKAA